MPKNEKSPQRPATARRGHYAKKMGVSTTRVHVAVVSDEAWNALGGDRATVEAAIEALAKLVSAAAPRKRKRAA